MKPPLPLFSQNKQRAPMNTTKEKGHQTQEEKWLVNFNELKKIWEETGKSKVHWQDTSRAKLYSWCRHQRMTYDARIYTNWAH